MDTNWNLTSYTPTPLPMPISLFLQEYVDVVVGYAVAEELDLSQLKDALQVQGLYQICELPIGKCEK